MDLCRCHNDSVIDLSVVSMNHFITRLTLISTRLRIHSPGSQTQNWRLSTHVFFFSKKTFFEADRDSDHYQLKCHNERSLTLILTWPLQIEREKTILEIKRQKATSLRGTKRIYLLLLVESNILPPENQNGAFFSFVYQSQRVASQATHKGPWDILSAQNFIMARIGRDFACNIYIMTPERYSDYVWPSHLVRKNM